MLEGAALVTGAASGIGRATARALKAAGASGLVLNDIDSAGLEALAAELAPLPVMLRVHDVADEGAWDATVAEIRARFGGLRYAVANAGVGEGSPIAAGSLAEWRRVIAINLDGAFLTLRSGFRLIEGPGAMVVTASVMAFRAEPGTGAYGASKAGVLQLARIAAREGAPMGIRVNAVCPGGVDTAIWEKQPWWPKLVQSKGSHAAAIEAMATNTPLGRFARPEEIAAQIVHLLSPASAFVTGTHILIDGGLQL